MQIAASVTERAKLLASSLEVHRRLELATGVHFHHASRAAAAAKPFILKEQYAADVSATRAGNPARHRRWADFTTRTAWAHADDHEDPLPWCGCRAARSCLTVGPLKETRLSTTWSAMERSVL